MPPPPTLMPQTPDRTLDRWRLRIGIVGTVLMVAYMAVLPLIAS